MIFSDSFINAVRHDEDASVFENDIEKLLEVYEEKLNDKFGKAFQINYVNDGTNKHIILMLYFVRVGFDYVEDGKYIGKKIYDKYSLMSWLINAVYDKREQFVKFMRANMYEYSTVMNCLIDDLSDVYDNFYLTNDVSIDDAPNVFISKLEQTYTSKNNVLWMSKHIMFKEQYNLIREVVGDNSNIYQYGEKFLSSADVLKLCDTLGISNIIIISDQEKVQKLRNELPRKIKIFKPKASFERGCDIIRIDEHGNKKFCSHQIIDGFEEIKKSLA